MSLLLGGDCCTTHHFLPICLYSCQLRRCLVSLCCLVVSAGIERLLTRSPGYDVQQLLAGAKPSMNALISGETLLR